jgi:hypothetical protein
MKKLTEKIGKSPEAVWTAIVNDLNAKEKGRRVVGLVGEAIELIFVKDFAGKVVCWLHYKNVNWNMPTWALFESIEAVGPYIYQVVYDPSESFLVYGSRLEFMREILSKSGMFVENYRSPISESVTHVVEKDDAGHIWIGTKKSYEEDVKSGKSSGLRRMKELKTMQRTWWNIRHNLAQAL